jgi:hypothetical protein
MAAVLMKSTVSSGWGFDELDPSECILFASAEASGQIIKQFRSIARAATRIKQTLDHH